MIVSILFTEINLWQVCPAAELYRKNTRILCLNETARLRPHPSNENEQTKGPVSVLRGTIARRWAVESIAWLQPGPLRSDYGRLSDALSCCVAESAKFVSDLDLLDSRVADGGSSGDVAVSLSLGGFAIVVVIGGAKINLFSRKD